MLIERDVQEQHVHPRLAEKTEIAFFDGAVQDWFDAFGRDVPSRRDSRNLPGRRSR
jgi:hypothetical protein